MKRFKCLLGILLFGNLAVSCLDDEPVETYVYKYSAIDSIAIDTIMPVNKVTKIHTYFKTDKSCQYFYNYDYNIVGNERTVAVILAEDDDSSKCNDIIANHERTLNFLPERPGDYTFRFWNGKDNNGNDKFIITKVTITPQPN